jgi:hypothetical protein
MSENGERAKAYLAEQAALCERFRQMLAPLFTNMLAKAREGMAPEEKLRRRPNVSLRLIADGQPLAKLLVLPSWDSRDKTMDCERLDVELMVEDAARINDTEAKQWRKQIDLRINPPYHSHPLYRGPRLTRYWPKSAEADVRRVVDTIRSFVENPRGVLARARDNCCICGKPLIDELSRSRGIGPVCIDLARFDWFKTERTICEPEGTLFELAEACGT